jgi:cobalt/nickel transport system permease protein
MADSMTVTPAPAQPGAGTPDWLLKRDVALCPCGCIGKRRKVSFVQKTLDGGADLLRQVMFSDDTAVRRGMLQGLDPRAKLLGLLGLLVAGAFLTTIPALAVLYVATIVLAVISALPLGFFIKRVWLFVPIFTGIVLIPATLSIVTSGDVIVTLWHWHGEPQGITRQGLLAAALVVSRVATSISLVVLLTLTTPWNRLLAALRALGVPRMFVLVIGMAYRYLFLLLGAVTDMYEARRARSVWAERHDRRARRFVFATAGSLIGRSMAMSEEVHQAMTARGYRGNARVLTAPRPGLRDAVFVLCAGALAAALLLGEHYLAR